LLNLTGGVQTTLDVVSRDVISDEAWGCDRAVVPDGEVDGTAAGGSAHGGRGDGVAVPTAAPWRDVPERFGNWNTIYKNFNRWADAGVWARVLERTQSLAQQAGDLTG
jgi:transposase